MKVELYYKKYHQNTLLKCICCLKTQDLFICTLTTMAGRRNILDI
jgi:hypothetical protein